MSAAQDGFGGNGPRHEVRVIYDKRKRYRGGVPMIAGAVEVVASVEDLVVEGGTGGLTALVRLDITCIFFFNAASRARMLVTTILLLAFSSTRGYNQ